MGIFEYVAVMVTVVLALGVSQLLSFIGSLVSGLDRYRIYSLHVLWLVLILGLHIQAWSTLWLLQTRPSWQVAQLLTAFVAASVIFVSARVLVPDPNANQRAFRSISFRFASRSSLLSAFSGLFLWLLPISFSTVRFSVRQHHSKPHGFYFRCQAPL